MLHGFATPEGTRRYAEQFPAAVANDFYRIAQDLHLSSVGMGTYLGEPDGETDRGYEQSALLALRSGINLFDTAINYRDQRSECVLGSALRVLLNANELQRDQIMVATKAGFLTPGAEASFLHPQEIAGGIHSLHPDFLRHQLDRSRLNLDLDTVDIFYIHNPEIQLHYVSRALVEHRIQTAFERLEKMASERVIRWYGTATWDGYRTPGALDLDRMIDLARYVGGDAHRFRFIQLPFNFGMIEAYINRDERGVSLLKSAGRSGVTVIGSAPLHQGRFARQLPDVISSNIPGLKRDATKAIQFARSTPGLTAAIVGMSNPEHVRENLELTSVPPMGTPAYEKLYRPVET